MLFSHWDSFRGGGLVPSLKDFLSRPHPQLQPHLIMLDVIEPDQLRVRLFATELVENAKIDLTGLNLLSFTSTPETSKELWNVVHEAAAHPCGTCNVLESITNSGRTVTTEVVSLPLTPFPGGPPCVVTAVGPREELDFKDSNYRVVCYIERGWLDIGAGVPRTA